MVSRMDFVRQPFCALKPLFFEVPNACNESLFIGRQWLFREICEHLSSDLPTNRGVIIVGYPGTGKTTAILQLVEHSCFGRSSDSNYQGKSQTVKIPKSFCITNGCRHLYKYFTGMLKETLIRHIEKS